MKPSTRSVADVAAGRTFFFADCRTLRPELHVTGIDIDEDELALNPDLDARVQADVSSDTLAMSHTFDLVLLRAGAEHFRDNVQATKNLASLVRPGGVALITFANRYAPFALVNRMLPTRVSSFLLRRLRPGNEGILGFPAYYDRCSYRSYRSLLEDAGFEIDEYYPSYFSSGYFGFLPPLFAVSLLGDVVRFATGSKTLCSYHLFVARRVQGSGEADE